MLVDALSDQDAEHSWMIDPNTGDLMPWLTSEDDGEPEDTDMHGIRPLPMRVWYGDMTAFADGISSPDASRRLHRALRGRSPFQQFRMELAEEYPELVEAWRRFRDARGARRAVAWLVDEGLVAEQDAERYYREHLVPDLP